MAQSSRTGGDRGSSSAERYVRRTVKRKVKRKVKKLNFLTLLICILALAAGLAAGIGAYRLVCENDLFELRGEKEYSVSVGEPLEYKEEGVKAVAFGKDVSDTVKTETNMTQLSDGTYTVDTSVPGRYYIKYTSDSAKYTEVCRIRTFVVRGEE